jgi:predicted ester cyclase
MESPKHVSRLVAALFLVAVVCLAAYAQTSAKSVLTREQAKAMGDRFLEARSTRNFALLDEVYAPNVVLHACELPADVVGLDSVKAYYGRTHAAFPDFKLTLDKMLLDGDYIIWFCTVSGTNTGPLPLAGMPPTGRCVRFSCIAVDRVENGKWVEEWSYFNHLPVLMQLGFILTPPLPPK